MFIHDDFLLSSAAAKRLYHDYAADNPIIDYHNHLPPTEIAENHRFADLAEIWLNGDHYKWRAMRANGCAERLCTGAAAAQEKYLAWVRTVPHTLCNPLYHWTHLELNRHFGIDELLDESTAERIWQTAIEQLARPELSVHGILAKFDVRALCTTDDPIDDLAAHAVIANSDLSTRVFPTFRPDRALGVDDPPRFNAWVDQLAAAADRHIATLDDFLAGLKSRHDYFHDRGCRLADHGLAHCYADLPSDKAAAAIFAQVRCGKTATPHEFEQFAAYLMSYFAQWASARDWTMQLHLGAQRNNSLLALQQLGRDTGFDSIGDWRQAEPLAQFLARCEMQHGLPRVILYNLNPADNFLFATMAGNFQDGATVGKIQFGSGWWFLDQKQGMEQQLRALANTGLLSRFIGMLTDSRSFMSFPRHEYFRRTLCQLVGGDMERGELPNDFELVGQMIRRICFDNVRDYLRIPLDDG